MSAPARLAGDTVFVVDRFGAVDAVVLGLLTVDRTCRNEMV
jgi:hypothetical protein